MKLPVTIGALAVLLMCCKPIESTFKTITNTFYCNDILARCDSRTHHGRMCQNPNIDCEFTFSYLTIYPDYFFQNYDLCLGKGLSLLNIKCAPLSSNNVGANAAAFSNGRFNNFNNAGFNAANSNLFNTAAMLNTLNSLNPLNNWNSPNVATGISGASANVATGVGGAPNVLPGNTGASTDATAAVLPDNTTTTSSGGSVP